MKGKPANSVRQPAKSLGGSYRDGLLAPRVQAARAGRNVRAPCARGRDVRDGRVCIGRNCCLGAKTYCCPNRNRYGFTVPIVPTVPSPCRSEAYLRDNTEHTIPLATCGRVREFVLHLCSSDAIGEVCANPIGRESILFCGGWGGGQGRPPTAFDTFLNPHFKLNSRSKAGFEVAKPCLTSTGTSE